MTELVGAWFLFLQILAFPNLALLFPPVPPIHLACTNMCSSKSLLYQSQKLLLRGIFTVFSQLLSSPASCV